MVLERTIAIEERFEILSAEREAFIELAGLLFSETPAHEPRFGSVVEVIYNIS